MNIRPASATALLGLGALSTTQAWINPSRNQNINKTFGPKPQARLGDLTGQKSFTQAPQSVTLSGVKPLNGAVRKQSTHLHAKNPHFGQGPENPKDLLRKANPKTVQAFKDFLKSGKVINFGVPGAASSKIEVGDAPYTVTEHPLSFFVLGSALSEASRALISAAKKESTVALKLSESSVTSQRIYARKRAFLQAKASLVKRDSDQWKAQVSELKKRFGDDPQMIASMPDFSMIALKPTEARFITGFGKAHSIEPKDLQ